MTPRLRLRISMRDERAMSRLISNVEAQDICMPEVSGAVRYDQYLWTLDWDLDLSR